MYVCIIYHYEKTTNNMIHIKNSWCVQFYWFYSFFRFVKYFSICSSSYDAVNLIIFQKLDFVFLFLFMFNNSTLWFSNWNVNRGHSIFLVFWDAIYSWWKNHIWSEPENHMFLAWKCRKRDYCIFMFFFA